MLAFLFAMLSTLPPKSVLVNIYNEHSYNKVGLIQWLITWSTLCRQHIYIKNKHAEWQKIEKVNKNNN